MALKKALFLIAFFILILSLSIYRLADKGYFHIPIYITYLQVILFFLLALIHSSFILGFFQGFYLFLIALSFSFIFEHIGLKTGLIFGRYEYKQVPLMLFGGVPLGIPLIWSILSYSGAFIGKILTRTSFKKWRDHLLFTLISSGSLVSIDLMADPLAVERGAWKWSNGGLYFGIPLRNFFGWFLVAFFIFLLFSLSKPSFKNLSYGKLFCSLPLIGYTFLGMLNFLACLQKNLFYQGLIGGVCVGIYIFLSWKSFLKYKG